MAPRSSLPMILVALAGCGGAQAPLASVPAVSAEAEPAAVADPAPPAPAVEPLSTEPDPAASRAPAPVVDAPATVHGATTVSSTGPAVAPTPPKPAAGPAPVVTPTPAATLAADPAPAPITAPDPAPPIPPTWSYTLSPTKISLFVVVRIDPSSFAASLGHDHAVGASGWAGTVTWPSADPAACKVHISVPVAGLAVDPPGTREAAGLEGDTPDRDKVKIKENIDGSHVLDASSWTTVGFDAISCDATQGRVNVTGSFSMHGQTRKVVVPMEITADAAGFHAKGQLAFKGSEWGMSPFTAAAGALKNQDALVLHIDVSGEAQ